MNLDEFTITPISDGKIQVMFTMPVTSNFELSLFLSFFNKHKKEIFVDFSLKPNVAVNGIICHKKLWTNFLIFIKKGELAKSFYTLMRDTAFKSVKDVEFCLRLHQSAEKTLNLIKKRLSSAKSII